MKSRYYVETWDSDKQAFTPQKGVRRGPYSLWGLRKAIRKLRGMGYPVNYSNYLAVTNDPAVLIYREDAP